MDELEEKISSLITDYLVKSNRDYRGNYNHQMLAKSLFDMLNAKAWIKYLMKTIRHTRRNIEPNLTQYCKTKELCLSRGMTTQSKKILVSVLTSYVSRIAREIEASTTARESWKLKQKIIDLEAQLEFGKPAASVTFWDKLNTRINIPYLILLCLSVVLIGGLTLVGLSADMTVNVEFNIGEILGALLIGTGVAAAGVSYATKDRRKDSDQNDG